MNYSNFIKMPREDQARMMFELCLNKAKTHSYWDYSVEEYFTPMDNRCISGTKRAAIILTWGEEDE